MKKVCFALVLAIASHAVRAQWQFTPGDAYMRGSRKADSLFQKGNFRPAARTYDTLFLSFQGATRYDLYQAACAWALAGDTSRAFGCLSRVVRGGRWLSLSRLQTDSRLQILHEAPRWKQLTDLVRARERRASSLLFRSVRETLDSMGNRAERNRFLRDSFQTAFGEGSRPLDSLTRRVRIGDARDLKRIKAMLGTYGWPGATRVGEHANSFLLGVIARADPHTQAICLPRLRAAMERGDATPAEFARLKDRVLVNAGKRQLYGTRYYQDPATGKSLFYPIEQPMDVDKRRASAGLPPLEVFARTVGIEISASPDRRP